MIDTHPVLPPAPMPLRLALVLALAVPSAASGQAVHPSLSGGALLDALVADYKPTEVLSLAASKDALYSVVDSAHVGGAVGSAGLYTGRFVPFDCDPTCDPSQDVYNGGSGLNQEHVWPRSQGAHCTSDSPPGCDSRAESDLHHLRAAVGSVNSARGNLPFGESPDDETTAWYGAAGASSDPPAADRDLFSERLGATLFEPRESEKGDVARAALYAYTMYGPRASGQADPAYFALMRATLLDWHDADPVDARESARMWRAAGFQQDLPNPYVLDATVARRAFGDGDPDAGTPLARGAAAYVPTAWVNELHYDNAGADTGELVEVAVDAAFAALDALTLTLYNGASGEPYGQHALDAFAAGERAGAAQLYHLALAEGGLQNGAPDGLALSFHDAALGDTLLAFVCYEGTMTAAAGPAAGATCRDLGVAESSATPVGASLQLGGAGSRADAFAWVADQAQTAGAPNAGQTLTTPLAFASVGAVEGWHMVATPAPMRVADVLANVWTQGAEGSSAPGGEPTVYRWRGESGGAAEWAPVLDLDETVDAGAGLAVYLYADDDPTVAGEQGGFPKLLPSAGYPAGLPFAFEIAAPADADDAYRLLGNPAPVPVAWSDAWARGDVGAGVAVYDASMPGYRVHNGTSGTLARGEIPAYAAFWVEATGPAPRLIAPAAAASPSRAAAVPALRLRADGGGLAAELVVADDARADLGVDGLDVGWRAPLAARSLALATRVDGTDLALDARPLAAGDTVALALRSLGVADTLSVTLSWPELPDVPLRLIDAAAGAAVDMVLGAETTVRVAPGAGLTLAVAVGAPPVAAEPAPPAPLAVRLAPNPSAGAVRLNAWADGAVVSAVVYDALGRRVATLAARPDGLAAALDLGRFGAGVYAVRVTAERPGAPPVTETRRVTVVR